MDYKNILEGTRPFFQGLPSPLPSSGAAGAPPSVLSLPLTIPIPLPGSQDNNLLRHKYEEGLGATLSQMYNTGSPSLRTPSSSSSPKAGPPSHLVLSSSGSPGSNINLHLRGGSSAGGSLVIPSNSGSSGLPPTNHNNSGSSGGTSLPTMVVRRESPLDLSVKTVRQSADSSTNNNPLEASHTNSISGFTSNASNCVNSTGGSGTPSSRTPTPVNTPNPAQPSGHIESRSGSDRGSVISNNVSNIIAAVANSTTGREREREKESKPMGVGYSGPQAPPSGSGSVRPSSYQERLGNSAPRPQSPASQPQQMGYPQNHHLFGHYTAPPALGGQPTPGNPKSYHHYLSPSSTNPANFRQVPGMPPGPGSHLSLNSVPLTPPSSSNSSSGTTTSTSQQPPSRPPSVIPPYNPPPPNFGVGLGAYHHQQQQPSNSSISHHAYHPGYSHSPYHSTAAAANFQAHHGQSAANVHHPYYAAYAHSQSHPSIPQVSQSQTNPSTSSSHSTPTSQSSHNQNQRNSNSSQSAGPGPPPSSVAAVPVTSASYQQQPHQAAPSSGGAHKSAHPSTGLPQHYGQPAATSQYHHYPQYFSQHHPQSQPRHGTPAAPTPPTTQAQQNPPPRPSQIPAPAQERHNPVAGYPPSHYGNPPGTGGHGISPSIYSSQQHYPAPNGGVGPPNHLYAQYHHSATPRGPPTNPPPSNYPALSHYPTHLVGPRPPAPAQLQQQPQQPPPASPYSSSIPHNSTSPASGKHSQLPAQVPIHPSSSPILKLPTHPNERGSSGGRASHGKTGEKRKNLLNLLRNSLETRIHEKQEKEKFQVNHQTWNFHGKKYVNPLPPPQPGARDGMGTGPHGPSSGSGSILTGMSNNSSHENSMANTNGGIPGPYTGLFGIDQRSNFANANDARTAAAYPSPDGDTSGDAASSLHRIRTKAEKKQLFPNLLSQIEQENSNKHKQHIMLDGAPASDSISGKYVSQGQLNHLQDHHSNTVPISVFDFQDDEEDSKSNLNLNRSRSVFPGSSVTPPGPSASPPKRKSGSKKFTSKLNKWMPDKEKSSLDSSVSKNLPSNSIVLNNIMPNSSSSLNLKSPPVLSIPGVSAMTDDTDKRIPAIDNDDAFWSTCDSFLEDLSANPITIKSRRGGLWAKLKPKSKDKPPGSSSTKGRRVRRNSTEEDADFQVEEEKSEAEDEPEENSEEENSDDSSAESKSVVSGDSSSREEDNVTLQKKFKNSPSSSRRGGGGGSSTPRKRLKRAHSESSISDDDSPKRSKHKGNVLKGTKVGKRTLRKRRATSSTNLIGKSGSDLDDEIGSAKSADDGSESDSSGDVESFSISDDSSSGSSDSDSDSNSNSSDTGSDDSDDDDEDSGRDSDQDEDEMSLDSTGKKVKSKGKARNGKDRSRLSKGRGRSGKKARKTRTSVKGGKKNRKNKTKRKKRSESTRLTRKLGRKLRPKRTCAKGKLKDISGESEEEGRGSSGEEWIMRGELGKRKREKRRTVFGDGSDFRRPGWEEELIDFKKKLRMPSKLIRVGQPSSLPASPGGKTKEKDSDYQPSAKEKDDTTAATSASSPAKSTKENKSPAKSLSTEAEPETKKKPKGRPPKTPRVKTEEKEKASPSTPTKSSKKGKAKSDSDNKLSDSDHAPEETETEKTPEKLKGKSKPGKKALGSKSAEKVSKSDTKDGSVATPTKEIKDEKELGMLPTPGPAGSKFNKKMSIKSVFGVDVTPTGSPAPPVKKVLRRNKFKSGFDYIRKKKKALPLGADGSPAPPPPKRPKVSQEKNMTEEDVQNELKGWVLNKGLGETALHRAARLGYPDVAAYSLEHDICLPNCKDNAGYSPLHETCMRGNLEVAKILLAYGANPSQAAPGGIRPLHEACENGHVELVRLLLSYGADPLLATYAGQAPIELAEHHPLVKVLLEEHIKDVQGKDAKVWEFRGTGSWAESQYDNGFDVTASPPHCPSDNDGEGFEFESSELPLPPIYMLKDSPYILIQDLINYVGLPKDRILKIHPAAEVVELNSNDFLEEAHCTQLLGSKFRLNSSTPDLLTLIKYDDRIKKMLNIETYIIK